MPAAERLPTGPVWRASAQATPAARSNAGALRDNIEAMAMAIVMALVLKYFIVEAYKIPTGSMQPTLMGDESTGVYDRILVDKLSYRFRDPERFDVVVFRYPLDRSKNFVKRIVGMPGEDLRIDRGDVWVRPDGSSDWRVLRRPRSVQSSTWKTLPPIAASDPSGSGWALPKNRDWSAGRSWMQARGEGRATWVGSVRDVYTHGYPEALREQISARRGNSGRNEVGDLRVETTVRAMAGSSRITIELTEGLRRYLFLVPGPTAHDDAAPTIAISGNDPDPQFRAQRLTSDEAWRLPAGTAVQLGVQNLDDLLELDIDGEVILSLEVPPTRNQSTTVSLSVDGEGADFADLAVRRDIYYLPGGERETSIPAGSYYMLGDNTQDSSDSREWSFVRFQKQAEEGGELARGNHRQTENPRYLPGGSRGTEVLLVDEWGERHRFPLSGARKLPPENAPFVTRDLILGRAVCVFWPIKPWRDVVRLKWVR